MMGTRTGALDPGAVLYLMEVEKLTLEQVGQHPVPRERFAGRVGISSDPRAAGARGRRTARAALALQLYVRASCARSARSPPCSAGWTCWCSAGIGEHSAVLRQRICAELGWLGVDIDAPASGRRA